MHAQPKCVGYLTCLARMWMPTTTRTGRLFEDSHPTPILSVYCSKKQSFDILNCLIGRSRKGEAGSRQVSCSSEAECGPSACF